MSECKKRDVRVRKGFTLFILNEDMNDIVKIIKSLDRYQIQVY